MNWDTFLASYRSILFEFLLELYIFYIIFQGGLKKKTKFYVRFVMGFLILTAIAFGIMFFYNRFGNTIWGRVITYVYLFVASVFHLLLCFDEPIFAILFKAVGAYAAQNLAYKIFLVFWYFGEYMGFFPMAFQIKYGNIYYYLFYYAYFAVEVLIIYFLFARKMRKYLNANEIKHDVLVIALAVLFITIVLCTIEDIYTHEIPMVLRQTSNLFSVTCCVCVLLLLSGIQERKNLQGKMALLQHAMKQKEEQFSLSKEMIDLINIKCHDMRHRISELQSGKSNLSNEEIKEIEDAISIYDSNIHTGNNVLDVILTEKNLYCERYGIRFSCMIDGEKLSFMSEGDVYCLFGNIIENAIEAVSLLDEQDKRTINLVMRMNNNFLIIQTENYFNGDIRFENNLPVTTKDDKNYHGFGIKSIKHIVDKYSGEMTCRAENNIFYLNILFSL